MTLFSRLPFSFLTLAFLAAFPTASFAGMLTDEVITLNAPSSTAQENPTLPALLPVPTLLPVQAGPALAEIASTQIAAARLASQQVTVPSIDLIPPTAPEEKIIVADAAPLSTNEMGVVRGGFADPSGMIWRFSVNVRTQLNGIPIFERSLVVAPSSTGQLQASANNDVFSQNIPSSFNVNMIGNGNGVAVTNAAGTTTILNQTASGVPSSIIMNSANNRNVAQSVNLSLILQNTAAMISNIRNANQAAALAQHNAVRGIGL